MTASEKNAPVTSGASKATIQPARGTHDILPGDSEKWQRMEGAFRTIVQKGGYREIRVPIFEHTELFKRGVGETTDIVNKEMYTFSDKSDRSLTLRPEGTAGVVRAYLSHGLSRQTPPVKLFYIGPMFRYERTQTGRQRQFHQAGVEAFGSGGPTIDAEVIVLAVDWLNSLGVSNFDVQLNSIGCLDCRPAYRQKLRDALKEHLSQLCPDCQDRFERNPLRMLDCKVDSCKQYYKNLPSSLDNLCEACNAHFQELQVLLNAVGVKPVINDRLVRGLDYYGRTVFELVSHDNRLGAQSTILAGGRYDYLVESLGGPSTPAVGWAAGLERISLLTDTDAAYKPTAFVVSSNPQEALKLATELRRAGISCELDFPLNGPARGFKRQFQQADQSGAAFTLIREQDEIASNSVTVKKMSDGTQSRVPVENIIAYMQENAANGV